MMVLPWSLSQGLGKPVRDGEGEETWVMDLGYIEGDDAIRTEGLDAPRWCLVPVVVLQSRELGWTGKWRCVVY